MAKKLSKRAKKQILNITFLVVLIGVTLTVVFVSQDINLHDIGVFLSGCNPYYIAGAFGGLLGYIIFEAISLHVIAHKLGHKSKFVSSVAYSTSDLYYSAITPSASGGQPASAYYMMRDGMSGGTAGFTVLFNIIGYTVATILVGLFGVIACPAMFGQIGHWFAKTLIILGFVIQLLLLALLLLCLFRARVILKIGGWGISLLTKIHIIKKPDKWRGKLDNVVTKYRSCRKVLKQHPMLFVNVLLLNIAQRVSQTLIPCFVMMAARPEACNFLELFCMQAYVLTGYNSIPLPGGTGAYEYLYPNVFGIGGAFDMKFILAAMMVSRSISYYICMIVTGLYTLVYHAAGLKNNKKEPEDVDMFTALNSEKVLKELADGDDLTVNKKSAPVPSPSADDTHDGGQADADCKLAPDGDTEQIELTEQTQDKTEQHADAPSETTQADDGGEVTDVVSLNEEIQENDDGNRKD